MIPSTPGEPRPTAEEGAPARLDLRDVTHEFNNVLAIIQGYAETLLDKVGDASPLSGDLDAIHRAAARGSSLVHRLEALTDEEAVAEAPRAPFSGTDGN